MENTQVAVVDNQAQDQQVAVIDVNRQIATTAAQAAPKMEETTAVATLSYLDNCDFLDKTISVLTQKLNLGDDPEKKKIAHDIKTKLLEIQVQLGLLRAKFSDVILSIRILGKSVADLLVLYQQFYTGEIEIDWNEHITKVPREALEKQINESSGLITKLTEMRETLVRLMNETGEIMLSLTYEGKAAFEQAEMNIKLNEEAIEKIIDDVVQLRALHLELDDQCRMLVITQKEEEFALEQFKKSEQNQIMAQKIKQENLSQCHKEIALQNEGLAAAIGQVKEDFKNNLSSKSEIVKMYATTIKTCQQKIMDLERQLVMLDISASGSISETTSTTTTITTSSKPLNKHYIFIVDESGSMTWGKETGWDGAMKHFLDFCHSGDMQEYDLVSCVGFSDNTKVRAECLTRDQAKQLKRWEPQCNRTFLAPGLAKAHELAKKQADHRTIYVALTDGVLWDQQESIKACEVIKATAPANMPKPVLFFIGIGNEVATGEISELIKVVNGSLFLSGPDGSKICDLLTVCGTSEADMAVIKTIFAETASQLDDKQSKMIKKEIERLTELRKNLQEKQVNATKDNSKADNEMEDVAEGIRTRFEEQNIKPLKVRISVIEAELKEISKLVLAEGIQVQKQQGIANAHKTKIEQEDEKIKETLDKIKDLQEQKLILKEKQKELIEKKEIEAKKVQENSGADKNLANVIYIKMMLNASGHQLTDALNFTKEMNTFITNICAGETNMHKAIYYGFNANGVRTALIKRLLVEKKASASSNKVNREAAQGLLDYDENKSQDSSNMNSFNQLLEKPFEEKNIQNFDNSDWVWAQLSVYFNYSEKEMSTLHEIMKSITFDELNKNLRDKDDKEKEEQTFAKLKAKIAQFKSYHFNQEVVRQSGLKQKVKADTKLVEEFESQIDENNKLIEKLSATVTQLQKKGGKAVILQLKQKNKKTIETLGKENKGLKESMEGDEASYKEEKDALKIKLKKKQAEEEEEEADKIKEKITKLEEEYEAEYEKKKGKIDANDELILECHMEIGGSDQPEKVLARAQAKVVKVENKVKEIEQEQAATAVKIKESKALLEKVSDKIDAERVAIEGDLVSATFILSQLRDLCFSCYQDDSRKQFTQQIGELIRQIKNILDPLVSFFNEDKKKMLVASGTTAYQSKAIAM